MSSFSTPPFDSHGQNSQERSGEPLVVASVAETAAPSVGEASVARRWGVGGYVAAVIVWSLTIGFIVLRLSSPYQAGEELPEGIEPPLGFAEQLNGMWVVGAGRMIDDPQQQEQIRESYEQSLAQTAARFDARLAQAIVYGEMVDASAALERLSGVLQQAAEVGYEPKPGELRRHATLVRLYENVSAGDWELPGISDEDRSELIKVLGWHGRLALAPAGAPSPIAERGSIIARAQGLSIGLVLIGLAALGAGVMGLGLSVLAVILIFLGKIRGPAAEVVSRGSLFIETFGLWLFAFIGFSLVVEITVPKQWNSFAAAIAFPASLVVLAWPVLRGLSAGELIRDVGWKWNSTVIEMFCGIAVYIAGIPWLFGSLIFSGILIAIFGNQPDPKSFSGGEGPAHPIQDMIGSDGMWGIAMVVITAVIMAPLVEETVFRGVLYRHLREVSHSWTRWLSVPFSAGLSAFVFAAIHPQGILLVPPLAMLGALFAVAREWRGSLAAPMTMHAVHNGMLVTMLLSVTWLSS